MNRARDIIVIRLDGLGDMILWLSSLQHIRKVYLHRHITVMIHDAWAPYLASLNMVDEVIPLPFISTQIQLKKRRWQHLRWLMLLLKVVFWAKKWRANMVIHPTHARTLLADLLATSIQSSQSWGVLGHHQNKSKKLQWIPGLRFQDMDQRYTHHIIGDPQQMILGLNAHVASVITGQFMAPSMIDLRGSTMQPPLPSPYLVWSPQAGDSGREWPLEAWEVVLTAVSIPIVVVGAGVVSPLLTKLIQDLRLRGQKVIDRVGQTTLPELAGLISNATIFLGNESGGIHLACALRVPSVGIVGGGHYGLFVPYEPSIRGPIVFNHPLACYGCNWRCHHGGYRPGYSYPCVDLVNPTVVRDQVITLLSASDTCQNIPI